MESEDVQMEDDSSTAVKAVDVAMSVAIAIAKTGFVRPAKQVFGLTLEELDDAEKISLEAASILKTICWGSASIPPRNFWLKQGIILHPPEKLFAYGIKAPPNGTKNFLMCIQAYFLKNLFFDAKPKGKERPTRVAETKRRGRYHGKMTLKEDVSKTNRKGSFKTSQILMPNSSIQEEMMIGGLADMLFRASEGNDTIFCMIGPENCFEPNAYFGIDGYTEKMYIFKSNNLADLKDVIRRFLPDLKMENGSGLLCLLYSLLLSRNLDRVKEDLQNEVDNPMVDMRGDCHPALINLILFGKATPYLHNGTMMIKDDQGVDHEREGIPDRSEIGMLLWEKDEATTAAYNIGSRLKTPTLPLWVTKCNDNIGVLFNPNKDLMRTYDAEKRFSLYYYSCHEHKDGQRKETKLTIETMVAKQIHVKDFDDEDSEEVPSLEQAIKTKWEDSCISWNGVTPYV